MDHLAINYQCTFALQKTGSYMFYHSIKEKPYVSIIFVPKHTDIYVLNKNMSIFHIFIVFIKKIVGDHIGCIETVARYTKFLKIHLVEFPKWKLFLV